MSHTRLEVVTDINSVALAFYDYYIDQTSTWVSPKAKINSFGKVSIFQIFELVI